MSQKHILLVDDEDDIREVAAISLEAIGGWRVSSANCGTEGIATALAERPDAILLDVMMPGIDGIEVCRRIDHDRVKVVMLSARTDVETKARARAAGAEIFLTKPFSAIELLDALEGLAASR